MPAAIDIKKERVVSTSHYRDWEWKDFNLKNILTAEFDIPVFVENDANLSAVGEKHYGEGRKYNNIVYVEISSGIGAGIIIDNRLIKGSGGTAGEIGFTISSSKKLDFRIKDKGFLEKHSSVRNIRGRAIEEIKKGKKTIITDMVKDDIKKITPYIVCEAATRGDRLANDIITNMVEILSVGIINLRLAFLVAKAKGKIP